MKNRISLILVLALFCLCAEPHAQVKRYSVENAHSHNDYVNPTPFFLAYNTGFGSIEADVFPVNGVLVVAHYKKEIQAERTLKNLYLGPLLEAMSSGKARKLKLLIDIKENYSVTLPLLIRELEPLQPYLSTLEKPNYLTIIISGNRPLPAGYKDYPGFIFFDSDLKTKHTEKEWNRVALVSLAFDRISGWNGDGELNESDREILRTIIDSAHSAGKPIRFWAAPDTKASWEWQMKLQADLIGTDRINDLGSFLRKAGND